MPEKAEDSRLAAYIREGVEPPLPEVAQGSYLIQMLDEIGCKEDSGMGTAPLSWQEIYSWMKCANYSLEYWEIQILRELSYAYVAELQVASKPGSFAPYKEQVIANDLDNKLKNAFRSMANIKKR